MQIGKRSAKFPFIFLFAFFCSCFVDNSLNYGMSSEYLNIIYWPTIRANNLAGYTHTHTNRQAVCFIMQICGKLFSKFGNCQCFFKSFLYNSHLWRKQHTHTHYQTHTHTLVCVGANSYLYNLIVSCTIPYLRTCRHRRFAVCVYECVCLFVCALW